jgi:hypothetical protein
MSNENALNQASTDHDAPGQGAASATSEAKPSTFLSAADIIRGGDEAIRTATVEKIAKDGRPGIIYYKPIPASTVMDLMELEDNKGGTSRAGVERMLGVVAEALVTPDGQPLVTTDDLEAASMETITAIVAAITEGSRVRQGNG